MTSMFAILVIFLALTAGLAFVWWCFSGAAAWIEPDPRPKAPVRMEKEAVDDE